MTKKEFLKLFWKIAKILKYKNRIIDIAFSDFKGIDRFGMCSVQDDGQMAIVYFNTDIFTEPRPFIIEVIIEELIHIKHPNHGKDFIKDLQKHFKRLKNL